MLGSQDFDILILRLLSLQSTCKPFQTLFSGRVSGGFLFLLERKIQVFQLPTVRRRLALFTQLGSKTTLPTRGAKNGNTKVLKPEKLFEAILDEANPLLIQTAGYVLTVV